MDTNAFALFILSLAGAVGAYAGAYLREKARNLATREDIDRLVRKAEDIKAEISGDLWEKQNRWTFKKDLYVRLLRDLGDAASAVRQLLYLDARLRDPALSKPLAQQTMEFIDEYSSLLQKSMVEIRRSASVVPLVCTEATERALEQLLEGWLKAETRTSTGYLEGCGASLSAAIKSVTNVARDDLRLTPSEAKQ
ncbi:MAG TPA: hypothetical protein VJN41_03485 [Alphaproteobacteria bacterium]|nr:hypothetical protein [Alphaproteobacteria bacterium]